MMDIGNRIKRLRNARKMTQSEFAERLGVTKSAVSSYENGSRLPSYDVLIKISRIFNITIDSLLTDDRNGIYLSTEMLTEEQTNTLFQLVNVFLEDNLQCGRIDSAKIPELKRLRKKEY